MDNFRKSRDRSQEAVGLGDREKASGTRQKGGLSEQEMEALVKCRKVAPSPGGPVVAATPPKPGSSWTSWIRCGREKQCKSSNYFVAKIHY